MSSSSELHFLLLALFLQQFSPMFPSSLSVLLSDACVSIFFAPDAGRMKRQRQLQQGWLFNMWNDIYISAEAEEISDILTPLGFFFYHILFHCLLSLCVCSQFIILNIYNKCKAANSALAQLSMNQVFKALPLSVLFLQLGIRCGLKAEGCGEEAVQTFSVSHPQSPLVPGTQAAQAHETREC